MCRMQRQKIYQMYVHAPSLAVYIYIYIYISVYVSVSYAAAEDLSDVRACSITDSIYIYIYRYRCRYVYLYMCLCRMQRQKIYQICVVLWPYRTSGDAARHPLCLQSMPRPRGHFCCAYQSTYHVSAMHHPSFARSELPLQLTRASF